MRTFRSVKEFGLLGPTQVLPVVTRRMTRELNTTDLFDRLEPAPHQVASAALSDEAFATRSDMVLQVCRDPETHQFCKSCMSPMEVSYFHKLYQTMNNRQVRLMHDIHGNPIKNGLSSDKRAAVIHRLQTLHGNWSLHPLSLHLSIHLFNMLGPNNHEAFDSALTCLLIACKQEEIYFPPARDFLKHSSLGSVSRLFDLECSILNELNFKTCTCTVLNFVLMFIGANHFSDAHFCLALFVLEVVAAHYEKLEGFLPSEVAAAVIIISNKMKRRPEEVWTKHNEQSMGFSLQALRPCIDQICQILRDEKENPASALRKRYSMAPFHRVGEISFFKF